jgi:uncharacterized protein (DUF779 family)
MFGLKMCIYANSSKRKVKIETAVHLETWKHTDLDAILTVTAPDGKTISASSKLKIRRLFLSRSRSKIVVAKWLRRTTTL